jgi:acetoin utilization deacetylase AcuC-like enzyme
MKDLPLSPVFYYADEYNVDLGGHVFPAIKFGHIQKRLARDGRFRKHRFVKPSPITEAQILSIHSHRYLRDLMALERTPRTHRSELPLTREILQGFLIATGGTLSAARDALDVGRAVNIGGGFHHAFREHAEGFCYLNDVAIAVRVLQKEKKIKRALIVDLDVHQGNGTAKIFSWDWNVFTFSMHEENNYPVKQRSSLDVGLKTGIQDAEYLAELKRALEQIRASIQPDIIFYVAGVDIYEKDRLGGLSVSKKGVLERDRMIRDFMPGVPLVTVLAGGYAINDQDTIELHFGTCEILAGFK